MKKQGSGKIYDSTPVKRGYRKPKAPAYTANKNPKDLYTKKGDDSSDKEEQSKSKRKDAGNDSSDPNDSSDNRDDDSSGDDKEKSNQSWRCLDILPGIMQTYRGM